MKTVWCVGAVSSWKFGDIGSYSLRDAKGLASGKHPGRCLLLGATTWPDYFGNDVQHEKVVTCRVC